MTSLQIKDESDAYRIKPYPITLSDLRGVSPIARMVDANAITIGLPRVPG